MSRKPIHSDEFRSHAHAAQNEPSDDGGVPEGPGSPDGRRRGDPGQEHVQVLDGRLPDLSEAGTVRLKPVEERDAEVEASNVLGDGRIGAKADATARNRKPDRARMTDAERIGETAVIRARGLKARYEEAREELLSAEPGDVGLADLKARHDDLKARHDRAQAELAEAERQAPALVIRARVVKGGYFTARGNRAMLREGKELDSLNYDLQALRRQGIKLERISDDERPNGLADD